VRLPVEHFKRRAANVCGYCHVAAGYGSGRHANRLRAP